MAEEAIDLLFHGLIWRWPVYAPPMFDWVVTRADQRALVQQAAGRVLAGGTLSLRALPLVANRVVTIAEARARVLRAAPWPDVVADWAELNDTAPYPGDASPALACALSALGASAFAIAFDPAQATAAVAWFERGALIQLEKVGASTVAWSPEEGLGRPAMTGAAGGAVWLARKLGGDDVLLDRVENQHAAGARAIVERAFVRLLDRPPPIDELAGQVALLPADSIRI